MLMVIPADKTREFQLDYHEFAINLLCEKYGATIPPASWDYLLDEFAKLQKENQALKFRMGQLDHLFSVLDQRWEEHIRPKITRKPIKIEI